MPQVEVPEIELHGLTHVGTVREDNQDSMKFCIPEDDLTVLHGPLYGIADGMGGFSHGGVASALALETFFETFYKGDGKTPVNRLKQGVQVANLGVYQMASRLGVGRMGTTLTVAHVAGASLNIAHVGDSRAYLVRDGKATCLTTDHTRVGELVRMRLLSPDKIRTHSQRSVLNKCLGLELFVQPEVLTVPVQKRDLIVLCTDGLWAMIEDQEFADFAGDHVPLEEYNQRILDEAMRRGSDDNLSVVSLRLRKLVPTAEVVPLGSSVGNFFKRIIGR